MTYEDALRTAQKLRQRLPSGLAWSEKAVRTNHPGTPGLGDYRAACELLLADNTEGLAGGVILLQVSMDTLISGDSLVLMRIVQGGRCLAEVTSRTFPKALERSLGRIKQQFTGWAGQLGRASAFLGTFKFAGEESACLPGS